MSTLDDLNKALDEYNATAQRLEEEARKQEEQRAERMRIFEDLVQSVLEPAAMALRAALVAKGTHRVECHVERGDLVFGLRIVPAAHGDSFNLNFELAFIGGTDAYVSCSGPGLPTGYHHLNLNDSQLKAEVIDKMRLGVIHGLTDAKS